MGRLAAVPPAKFLDGYPQPRVPVLTPPLPVHNALVGPPATLARSTNSSLCTHVCSRHTGVYTDLCTWTQHTCAHTHTGPPPLLEGLPQTDWWDPLSAPQPSGSLGSPVPVGCSQDLCDCKFWVEQAPPFLPPSRGVLGPGQGHYDAGKLISSGVATLCLFNCRP